VNPSVQGQLGLILHAHLPYVRHPEHPRFFEETWLFEAITECYLPLVWRCDAWTRDALPWRLSLTLTPTLCAMLGDPFLEQRYLRHLDSLIELGGKELDRTTLDPVLRPLPESAVRHLQQCRAIEHPGRWILERFRVHSDAGNLEILGCAGTHALLPLLVSEPASLRAQLEVGCASHEQWFGRTPRGFWLPECGWTPELEGPLLDLGVEWIVLESHGVLDGTPTPHTAVFRPVRTPGGLVAVGRDPASARQVWSRSGGYPGDPRYREFHRDLGHDAEWDYVRPHLSTGRRTFTGFKYHRITGVDVPAESKQPYLPAEAANAVSEHAAHFVSERLRMSREVGAVMGGTPLLVAPYDAELFGHWWHEGPDFLDQVIRRTCEPGSGLELVIPGRLAGGAAMSMSMSMPAASTWGEGGHLGVWLDESNTWMQTPLRRAGWAMRSLADRYSGRPVGAVVDRALRQAGRELLLAQSSDWPFLVRMRTAGEYPAVRIRTHLERFHALSEALSDSDSERMETDSEFETRLSAWESLSPIFPWLDWRVWRSRGE